MMEISKLLLYVVLLEIPFINAQFGAWCQKDWGPTCTNGPQAPINIISSEALRTPSIFRLQNFEKKLKYELVMENENHVFSYFNSSRNKVLPIIWMHDRKYTLFSCHFHMPSEHQIDGESFDLEAHCLFFDTELYRSNISTALKEAIYAVWLGHIVPDSNLTCGTGFESFLEPLQKVLVYGTSTTFMTKFSFAEITGLNVGPRGYYTYRAHAAFPPCVERWYLIFESKIVLSNSVMMAFNQPTDINGNYQFNQRRPIQPMDGHIVTYHPDYTDVCGLI